MSVIAALLALAPARVEAATVKKNTVTKTKNCTVNSIVPFTVRASSETATILTEGQTNKFTVTLGKTKTNCLALIDIEVQDSSGTKVLQKYWNKVLLKKGKSYTYTITTPDNWPAGQYSFSVGLFRPDWKGKKLNWFDSLQTFVIRIASGDVPGQVLIQTLNKPTAPVAMGTAATVSLTLINSGGSVSGLTVRTQLYDATNTLVHEEAYPAQTIDAKTIAQYWLTLPTTLAAGTYRIALVIDNADGTTNQVYNNLGAVTVQ